MVIAQQSRSDCEVVAQYSHGNFSSHVVVVNRSRGRI